MARANSSFFVTCAPGVEPVLHAELKALRLARIERQVGGVYFEGTLRDAWRANLWLRTAVRVLMRVRRFPCPDEEALYREAREVDWGRFLTPEGRLVVDAHASESVLDHTRFIEQRVKDAIVDGFREKHDRRPSVDREDADLGVVAHLFRDRCTLLVDTSGHALHRRGWRKEQGRAPLAETLAAAVLRFAEWDERSPLWDPFCGSGTLLIEAAHQAAGTAPGSFGARFGFERWPEHDASGWAAEQARAKQDGKPKRMPVLRGLDLDAEQVERARKNARSAGVAEHIEFEVGDARRAEPRRGWNGWVVSNLPYGERVGRSADLEGLYRAFGQLLRERCAGYRAGLLTTLGPLIGALQLPELEERPLLNGGLECRVLTGAIEERT